MERMATDSVCPKCGGTGWMIVERAGLSGAEACDCRAQGRPERLEERAQIPPLYRHASFDTFSTTHDSTFGPELRMALSNVQRYVQDFPLPPLKFRAGDRPGLL